MTQQEYISRMAKWCAYRERSHAEARTKLRELGCRGEEADEVLVELIRLDFLNEERFAKAYVRGKYRMSEWGREKIRMGLRAEQINDKLLERVLKAEVDQEEYLGILRRLLSKKARSLGGVSTLEQRQKLKAYLYGKGFEGSLIDQELRALGEGE